MKDNIENSMCADITSDNFDYELMTYEPKKYKSEMNVGDIKVMNTKHFNWINKIFWKMLLGIEIKDVEVEI